ncbi:DoxX family protein [candidate division KSB1 bacterium]|nr:DoxX family protein [candidate division KSB1 bacterium]NIR71171.1 DoxX family protein [candidate division KSB1 bacterium]NIS23301.1 DoxX family protein [candidate division KSB1 bacterium]NIT70180.1 DoxX family protein [candidate division KSB1 bacterium]NIU23831.1 DoxX family protein [candidate division KSB1 bacterium]
MNIKELLFGGSDIADGATNWGLTILRVFSGLALAFGHGIGKIPPSDGFIQGVAKLGFPLPGFFAWAAGCSEFFGGILLAAGLVTRPAAFFILCTMSTAGFIRHAQDPFTTKEKALLFAAIALLFLLIGAGKYGVDVVIRRKVT